MTDHPPSLLYVRPPTPHVPPECYAAAGNEAREPALDVRVLLTGKASAEVRAQRPARAAVQQHTGDKASTHVLCGSVS
ncbi:hypothetical protein NUW54_g14578 [Trametes sanguinea]|uniref:Uncharacterized protein n=1 Tax=Trametes sanguinea TaxID=158606 RepID=A0ACC1MBF2_9APHY|nr:hypothetical protein NUW54_g14578 [Trametes sanguinea]